jgi:hypothetical protein
MWPRARAKLHAANTDSTNYTTSTLLLLVRATSADIPVQTQTFIGFAENTPAQTRHMEACQRCEPARM